MAQLLIRKLDETLVQQLQSKAATDGESVEHVALEIIRKAMKGAPTTMPDGKLETDSGESPKRKATVLDDPHSNPRFVEN